MTEDGMCGVFIADSVLAGWWRSEWKASDHYLNRDGVSPSADPANHRYTNSTKIDSHPVHYSDPTQYTTVIPPSTLQ